jgi:hypothetical protein
MVNRSASPTNTFRLPNDTNYPFAVGGPAGISATPSPGVLNVTGSAQSIQVAFRGASVFEIEFSETGLPSPTTWVVQLNGTLQQTQSSTLGFFVRNGTYRFAVGQTDEYVPTPAAGNVTVNGSEVIVPISFLAPTTYEVSFIANGLVNESFWWVWLGGATNGSNSSVLTFDMTNGSYVYVAWANDYVTRDSPGNLTVDGSPLRVTINFTAAPYTVTFAESGLPSGSVWEVTLEGVGRTGVATVPFSEPNGTFPYTVTAVPGLVPTPASGNVTVHGSDVNVSISFGPPTYLVTFAETGLPAGTPWSVLLNGAPGAGTGSTISFIEPNGTYDYSVPPVSGFTSRLPGTVNVSGANASVLVGFYSGIFTLTFHETGLPTGTGWGVLIGSQSESSLTSDVNFTEPNGTYGYVILAVVGYVTAYSGFVSVSGGNTVVTVTFHPETYPIVFIEFGLPAGSNWSVTVSNSSNGFNETQSSTTSSITLFLPNGTYRFSFNLPAGYSANSSSSQITVAGKATTGATLTISPTGAKTTPSGSTAWPIAALAAIVILGIAVVVLVVLRVRRPPSASPPPPT